MRLFAADSTWLVLGLGFVTAPITGFTIPSSTNVSSFVSTNFSNSANTSNFGTDEVFQKCLAKGKHLYSLILGEQYPDKKDPPTISQLIKQGWTMTPHLWQGEPASQVFPPLPKWPGIQWVGTASFFQISFRSKFYPGTYGLSTPSSSSLTEPAPMDTYESAFGEGDEEVGGSNEEEVQSAFHMVISARQQMIMATSSTSIRAETFRWSDVAFAAWTALCVHRRQRPDTLKYILRRRIVNTEAKAVIAQIALKMPKQRPLTVDMYPTGSFGDYFAALLGTPNLVGVAYLLLDHKCVLGRKTITKITLHFPGGIQKNPDLLVHVNDFGGFEAGQNMTQLPLSSRNIDSSLVTDSPSYNMSTDCGISASWNDTVFPISLPTVAADSLEATA